MFRRLFRQPRHHEQAYTIYNAIVAQARQPDFYTTLEVPDSVDGRFEMIALHAFLVLQRVKGAPPPAAELGQALFDTMFADMDRSLREMGAGDLGVGVRVKAMAHAFYGRIAAYESALAAPDDDALAAALRRNVYGTRRGDESPSASAVEALARYVRLGADRLAQQPAGTLLTGIPDFPAVPAVAASRH